MADTCTRCGDVISDRTPSEGYTTRIGLTRTRIVWRLRFDRFRWHWLPEHADERVSRFYTELDLCDWCTGDVFLFAQGLPPRPPRVVTPSRTDRQPPTSATQAKGGQGPAGSDA